MLYPIDTETRERRELGGMWSFIKETDAADASRYPQDGLPETAVLMPVPSSYNDLSQDVTLRDHIGAVWYECEFYLPKSWETERTVLRFGSVTHHSEVWLNGIKVAHNKGGFLPFEASIASQGKFSTKNRLTVRVDNQLDWTCLPPGEIEFFSDPSRYPEGYRKQVIHFDFFNYAGIHRPVVLYKTPQMFIKDLRVVTQRANSKEALISIATSIEGEGLKVDLTLCDTAGKVVAHAQGNDAQMVVNNPSLWKPGKAYLYTLHVRLFDTNAQLVDHYPLPVGIRTVHVHGKQFFINDEPFIFKGFGKHEDAGLRGRAMDFVTVAKDFELMRWIGANSFRTSHYPYAEEVYRLADQLGIVVIDEVPAVGMNTWNANAALFSDEYINSETLKHHIDCVTRMIERDKNHPCVVMWSAANECATWEEGAVPYFQSVTSVMRQLDPTRPLIIVENDCFGKSRVTHLFDVIGVNRYDTWYADAGCLDLTALHMREHLIRDYETYGKPVLLAEVGCDTIPGLHADPPCMFSEEYQSEMLEITIKEMEKLDFVIGTHVWNFADFATKQGLTRVGGNRKGVFTRERQPKLSAHTLRKLWTV